MGLITSSQATDLALQTKQFPKAEIKRLFRLRAGLLLSPNELASLSGRVKNITEEGISVKDLKILLTWGTNAIVPDLCDSHKSLSSLLGALQTLYKSFVVLNQLPFLHDALGNVPKFNLSFKDLLIPIVFHSGRISKMWPSYDYPTVFFASLAMSLMKVVEKDATSAESYPVELVDSRINPNEDSLIECENIKWSSLEALKTLDGIVLDTLCVSSLEFLEIVTLLLVVESITLLSQDKMAQELSARLQHDWNQFETSAMSVIKFLDPETSEFNIQTRTFKFCHLKNDISSGFSDFLFRAMKKLVKHGLFMSVSNQTTRDSDDVIKYGEQANDTQNKQKDLKIKRHVFYESRLLNISTVGLISIALSKIEVGIAAENLVELYNGSKSGFSIRSLELKIFKWQAATVFLVSGKRVRQKTMETNRRYQAFDSMFPRYFRPTEKRLRAWQSDQDLVTYAVYVNHPWVHSNKKNFGNSSITIISILPRFDVFTSKKGAALGNELIYFNNLGMGLGFGNLQPINKNNSQRYLPGSVSLTVDSNLEFAVFRHLPSARADTSNQYFNTSFNNEVSSLDFEDRFVITDLEVWGVGSVKELEEQRKQWEWEEKEALARQSINIRSMGEERAFLEMAGLVGNHAGGGSI